MSRECEQNWNAINNEEKCNLVAKCLFMEYYCFTVCEGFVKGNVDLTCSVEVDELNSNITVVKDMLSFMSKEDLTEIRNKLKPLSVLTDFSLRLLKQNFDDNASNIFISIDQYLPYLFETCLTGDGRRTHMIKALNSQRVLRLIDANQKRLAMKLFRELERKDGLNYEADIKAAMLHPANRPDYLQYSSFLLEMKQLVKSVIETLEKPLILDIAALISMYEVTVSRRELLNNFSEFLGRRFEKKSLKEHGSLQNANFCSKDVASFIQGGSSSSKIDFRDGSTDDEIKDYFSDLNSTQDYCTPPFQIIESTQIDNQTQPDQCIFIDNLNNQIWFAGSEEKKLTLEKCENPPERPSRITLKEGISVHQREKSFEARSLGKMSFQDERKSDNPAEGISETSNASEVPERKATEKTAERNGKRHSEPQKEIVYLDLASLIDESCLKTTESHQRTKAANSLAEMQSKSSRSNFHHDQPSCPNSWSKRSNNNTWPEKKQVRFEPNDKNSNSCGDMSTTRKTRRKKSRVSATVTSASQVRSSDEEQESSDDEVESWRTNSTEKKKEYCSSFDKYVALDLNAIAKIKALRKSESLKETPSKAKTESLVASQNIHSNPLQSKKEQSVSLAKESGNSGKNFLFKSKEHDRRTSSPKRKEREDNGSSVRMKKTTPTGIEGESKEKTDTFTDKGQQTTSLANAGKRDCEKPNPENLIDARRKRRRLLLNGNSNQNNDFKTNKEAKTDVRNDQQERDDDDDGSDDSLRENVDRDEHDSSFVLRLSPVIEFKNSRDDIDVIGPRYDLRTCSPKKISFGNEGMVVPNGPNQEGGKSNKPDESSKKTNRSEGIEDEDELETNEEGEDEEERVVQNAERQNDQRDHDEPEPNQQDAGNEVSNEQEQNEDDEVNDEEQENEDNEVNNRRRNRDNQVANQQQNEDNEVANRQRRNRDNDVDNRRRNAYFAVAQMLARNARNFYNDAQRRANEDIDSGESVSWSSEDDDAIRDDADRVDALNRYFDRRIARGEARNRARQQALPVRRQPRRQQGRRRFLMDEEDWLRDGVRRFGAGNWSVILTNYPFRRRTAVNLKDKWRNLVRNGATGF